MDVLDLALLRRQPLLRIARTIALALEIGFELFDSPLGRREPIREGLLRLIRVRRHGGCAV